ncbi:MAG: hypothetical protein CMA59_00935 [Euryarchaeota archaeon]|jgi:hypothetical protein|nr:hypothetical protein [Euryarchaeota archaeon]|tara:strand:+ start:5715 stop:6035 length:321 start_codon:yes stop_codon:yes gene_type:complete
MKFTDEQVATINASGCGCRVIATGITPDAAEDKHLPTNSYLMELEKDGQQWFDIVMGGTVAIFDCYYDTFGHCVKKMTYTKGAKSPGMYNPNPKPPKQPKKPPRRE